MTRTGLSGDNPGLTRSPSTRTAPNAQGVAARDAALTTVFMFPTLPTLSAPAAEPTTARPPRFPVRPATLRDAKAIAEAHVSAWQESVRQAAGPSDALHCITVERRQAAWREAIDLCEPQVLVATDKDKVIGFVAFDRSRDKGTPSTTGEVWALYVAPAHWGRGVGQTLWDAARCGLQEEGCIKATLWMPTRFERSLRFVEQAGFRREEQSARNADLGGVRIEEIRLSRSVI